MKNTIGLISANYTNDSFGILTKGRTIATMPYGGRYRIIDFALSSMVNSGISTVGLITPYNYRSIIDHVGVGKPWTLGRKAGGLFMLPGSIYGFRPATSKFLMRDLIQNRLYFERDTADYVLFSGSSKIFNIDFNDFIDAHEDSGREVTMLVHHIHDAHNTDELYIGIDDEGKVNQITNDSIGEANLYLDCMLINREYLINLLSWFGALEHKDIIDIIAENLNKMDVGIFEYDGYVGSINNASEYMQVNMDLLNWDIRASLFYHGDPVYTNVQDEPPAQYSPDARVSNSLISTGCIIEGTVENSILFRNCHIAPGAIVRNSIIMRRARVGVCAHVENVICDQYVTFGTNVQLIGSPIDPIKVGKNLKL